MHFHAQSSAERLDIGDFFSEIDLDLCQYAYAFRESGFTYTMKYWQEQDFQSLSEHEICVTVC